MNPLSIVLIGSGVVLIFSGWYDVSPGELVRSVLADGTLPVKPLQTPTPTPNVDPKTGVPNQDPSKPFLRDNRGRVF